MGSHPDYFRQKNPVARTQCEIVYNLPTQPFFAILVTDLQMINERILKNNFKKAFVRFFKKCHSFLHDFEKPHSKFQYSTTSNNEFTIC